MLTKVQKWGNSLALRIPKSIAADAQIENDTLVELTLVEGKLVVQPVTPPKYTLEQLLGDITVENLHAEVESGTTVGNEAW